MTSNIQSQTLWNRWVTTKPIIPILLRSCNGQIFLSCLTDQGIIQQGMKEMQNANMSFAFFSFEAQRCTLQGLFTDGFREVCLNEQFESSGPVWQRDRSERRKGSWQCLGLSIQISAGLGSRWDVTAPDLFLLKHPFIRVLHPSGVSSTAITEFVSRAT